MPRNGLVPLLLEVLQRQVGADRRVVEDLHSQVLDVVHLEFYDVTREPVLGDTQMEHPAGHRRRLEDRGREARQRKIVRYREPGWPRADDRDSFLPRLPGRRRPG
jgi:hypothetical protein